MIDRERRFNISRNRRATEGVFAAAMDEIMSRIDLKYKCVFRKNVGLYMCRVWRAMP